MAMEQTGRNDPCPCGSGRKYKHCCLGRAVSGAQTSTAPRSPTPADLSQLVTLFQSRRYAELESRAHLLLQRFPNSGVVWKALGISFQVQGKFNDAVNALQKAAELLPNDAEAHYNLGNILKDLKQLNEAAASYRRALKITPNIDGGHNNLGNVLRDLGQLKEAAASYRRALAINPKSAGIHNNLGNVLRELGKFDDALESCHRALAISPDFADAHYNLGNILNDLKRPDEAAASYRRALAIKPDLPEVHINLGNVLKSLGHFSDAEASYRRALEITPDSPEIVSNLGNVLQAVGQFDAASEKYNQALEIRPGYVEAHSSLLFSLNSTRTHAKSSCLEVARQYGRLVAWKANRRFSEWPCERDPGRLRVGLVSGDFRDHPVGHFLESTLAQLDPSRIELIAYPTVHQEDELTARIKPRFAAWKPLVGLSDEAAARIIHADGVHVLLDLSGHTSPNRLPVFAWKPAPVQCSWLGYFATTGVAEMDYLLADETGVSESHREDFTEAIWYLPDTRLCFTPPEYDLAVSPLPALKNGCVTFGCFQNLAKVGDKVLSAWGKILTALPSARLRLQSKHLDNPKVQAALRLGLQQSGIDPSRVVMHGGAPREAYLGAHAEVDVILDTFPYTGGTTTCEALWMGVPIVTLAGDTLLSRQGASLLTAAGLRDWIGTDESDYVAKAIALAGDLPRLAGLRAGLRAQALASPVFDASRFARNFEAALWGMWQDRQGNEQADIRNAAHQETRAPLPPMIEIVSASKLSESEFWSKSALGISLQRLKQDTRFVAQVAYENRRGLPEIFNERINAADGPDILVFIHDDVWIDDYAFVDRVLAGLQAYDVIGVTGNRRRARNQTGWLFLDDTFTQADPANLSGRIAHGSDPFGDISFYGPVPAECELLDGVFLAAKRSLLKEKAVRFDPRFDFHFYDMDFCRSARDKELRLGTWPVALTHQSIGAFRNPHWREKCRLYLDKWKALGQE
jgi:predicted O-linked N-acetylglucosamine transferase (SPINDLY family)